MASLLAGAGCFDPIDEPNWLAPDGGVTSHADWGSFLPGGGTPHGQADVSRAYGAPDGDALQLGPGGVLTLSFGNQLVYDRAGADFVVHGNWDAGETLTVLGSEDGATYTVITQLSAGNTAVDMTLGTLSRITYLQLQDGGTGNGVEVDAVEITTAP